MILVTGGLNIKCQKPELVNTKICRTKEVNIMDANQIYIQNLKVDDVPWHRITTAYGRATEFPQDFKNMWNMSDVKVVKKAFDEVTNNIEHQGTLWHSTPFAMIFLVRIFERAVFNTSNNEVALFLVEQLLNFFGVVAECIADVDELEHPNQLSLFSDMLKEEYLWSEEYDEEEDDMRYEEDEVFPGDLFYSFYYYSYQVLLLCKPMLRLLENTHLSKMIDQLQGVLTNFQFDRELNQGQNSLKV